MVNLVSLRAARTHAGAIGATAFAGALIGCGETLRLLDISGNRVRSNGASALASAIRHLTCLASLNAVEVPPKDATTWVLQGKIHEPE